MGNGAGVSAGAGQEELLHLNRAVGNSIGEDRLDFPAGDAVFLHQLLAGLPLSCRLLVLRGFGEESEPVRGV